MARDLPEQLRCQLVPTAAAPLLLPNTAVAEVVGYVRPEDAGEGPPWLLGTVAWRGLRLPLVSLEALWGREDAPPTRRVVVMNGVKGEEALPFYALAAAGIPHLLTVRREALEADPEGETPPLVKARVKVAGQEAVLPDLDALEGQLLAAGLAAVAAEEAEASPSL